MSDLNRIRAIISKFNARNDVDNEYAWYLTNVPRVAPKAYLNVIFKPADHETIESVSSELLLPRRLTELYRELNGCIMLGALSVYGLTPIDGWPLFRTPYTRRPYDLRELNQEMRTLDGCRVCIGRYKHDHSPVFVHRESGEVTRQAGNDPNSILNRWSDFDGWFFGELQRLVSLFDQDGNPLSLPEETLPDR